ncbi:uncharacterized protein PG998_008750 [Apiospora kogelbergensis]|uniref:uncharacterized protein n=1 Tax=Apiospora kogelbergensis TaxID=1337665 RepID=UPI00312D73A4
MAPTYPPEAVTILSYKAETGDNERGDADKQGRDAKGQGHDDFTGKRLGIGLVGIGHVEDGWVLAVI